MTPLRQNLIAALLNISDAFGPDAEHIVHIGASDLATLLSDDQYQDQADMIIAFTEHLNKHAKEVREVVKTEGLKKVSDALPSEEDIKKAQSAMLVGIDETFTEYRENIVKFFDNRTDDDTHADYHISLHKMERALKLGDEAAHPPVKKGESTRW